MNSGIIALLLFAGFSYVLTAAPTYPGRPNYDNIPQCMQPPEAGLCLAYIPSFYYNPATKKCQSFVYGGCQGNKNRFFSEDECMKKCGNQSG
ncbi:tissue factor pathway inhibitor [Nephila pilipes]|uniref:Tissue factor pathway inhibitor n=1 Tax=Nephila pilipes TaxID=299642 RepID=A0A8X6QEJ8_NEPPI|nr:tissue factor pathway inhibitor [Nephila pilipes]